MPCHDRRDEEDRRAMRRDLDILTRFACDTLGARRGGMFDRVLAVMQRETSCVAPEDAEILAVAVVKGLLGSVDGEPDFIPGYIASWWKDHKKRDARRNGGAP